MASVRGTAGACMANDLLSGIDSATEARATSGARERSDASAPDIGDAADLLRAACAGDETAFVALYRAWQGPIYRFALHMSGAESLAEDITQEVFVVLARDGSRFDSRRGSFSTYLFAIARNLLRRRLRRERVYEAISDDPDESQSSSQSHPHAVAFDPDVALDRRQAIQRVRRAVRGLPVAFREAVVLCDLEELSYAEAAAALDCPIGTVRSRLSRGRALLADRLGIERRRGGGQ
jgi:RNA polymerase sigma-70 factor (ECF subfamily)